MDNKYEIKIRRLFHDETSRIEEIQDPDPEKGKSNYDKFVVHYPNHSVWIKQTLKEIKNAKKAAFAAFIPVDRHKNKGQDSLFVGSVILKKGISGEAEIKNLLTYQENLQKKYPVKKNQLVIANLIKKQLINKVENFCIERRYRILLYEVPSSETNDINFLITQGFKLLSTVESRYKNGDYFYIFSKNLDRSYGGDPYDYPELMRRLLTDFFQFDGVGKKPEYLEEVTEVNAFRIKFSIKALNNQSSLDLRGELITAIPEEVHHKVNIKSLIEQFNHNCDIKILLTELPVKEKIQGVKIISLSEIEEIFDFKRALLSKFYKRNQVYSLVLNVDIDNYTKIEKTSKEIAVFTFDGMGSSLVQIADLHKEKMHILLYSPPKDSFSKGGIWAICKFKRAASGNKTYMNRNFVNNSKIIILDRDIYQYNANYNDETEINAFIISLEKALPAEVNIEDCLAQEMKNFIAGNDYEFGMPDTYLDKISTNQILAKFSQTKLPVQKPKKMFISYAHKDGVWKDILIKNLATLRKEKLIIEWHDGMIKPGKWDPQIKKNMNDSDIFILLVTSSFLESLYITTKEITKAYALFKKGKAIIIPIICEPCDWESYPLTNTENGVRPGRNDKKPAILGEFQPFPRGNKKTIRYKSRQKDILDVIQQLRIYLKNQ